jgi:hypothetical protein
MHFALSHEAPFGHPAAGGDAKQSQAHVAGLNF